LPINNDTFFFVFISMALGKKSSELINSYKKSIEQDLEQIKQLRQTKEGITVLTDPLDPNSQVAIVEGVNTMINRFGPSTKGLDNRIVTINAQIRDIQDEILALGQSANAVGCGTTGDGVVEVVGDVVTAYNWSFTTPNPFEVSTSTLTASNLGVGTYVGVSTVSIGTHFGIPGVGTCVGYATSISTLEASLSTYRSERNSVIVQVNALKEARSNFELQKFGYDQAESKINAQITAKSNIITALEDPENHQYFDETL